MMSYGARALQRRFTALAGMLAVALALSGCAGIKMPSPPNPFKFGGGKEKKASARVAPGQRIPVLLSAQTLEPAPALKGVDFSIPQPGGSSDQGVDHVAAGADLKVAWRRKVGSGDTRLTHIMSDPVVGDGRIYLLDGKAQVAALDAATGREIWRSDLSIKRGPDREAFGGGVAYADGTVFVSSGYRFVAALDAANGRQLWRTETSSPVHGAPTAAAGKVYVIDVVDQLQAYDAKTGASAWTYQPLEEPARMLIAASPAVLGDQVVAPFASGELVALSAANGTDLWTDVLSLTNRNNALSEIRDISGRPAIYRGTVYAGSHSGVLGAVDLRTGQRIWSLPVATISSPWPAGDVVYAVGQGGEVLCIARDSGQIYWISKLNEGKKKKQIQQWSGPILASNRLVMVSDQGELRGLDPKTGQQVASLRLGAPAFMTPIATGGMLYVLTNTGELIAIR
jgi:outer membrane protein assembly factor BamB